MVETIIESPRFPDDISFGSTSTTGFSTDVITVNSGVETRNVNWVQSRHSYDVAFGIRNQIYLDSLVEYFQAVKGKAYGFRYKDWSDYSSASPVTQSDQLIGLGDSTDSIDGTSEFQIVKNYTIGSQTTVRDINKLVAGTLVVEVNGVLQTTPAQYTVNNNTGLITFTSGNHPLLDSLGDGSDIPEEVRCGYEFDVPVRFDSDELSINMELYEHGSTSVPIVELRI